MESPDDMILQPMPRQRRSLPVYKLSSDRPPYPDSLFRWRAYPAPLEEGHERLPEYPNAVYLAGLKLQKMELTAPGMQVRDRKWRQVFCMPEGTAFRVYKCPRLGRA